MRNLIFFLIFFLSYYSYSQDEYHQLRNTAIINKGINAYNIYSQELKKDNHSENWNVYLENFRQHLSNIYVIDENNLPVVVESTNANISFKVFDIYDKGNRHLLKDGVKVWKVSSVLNGNKLRFEIVDFLITYKKDNYRFGNLGGTIVEYQYSCSKAEWELISTVHRGI